MAPEASADSVVRLRSLVETLESPGPEADLPPLSEEGRKATKAALRLLKTRARSVHEIRERLQAKEFADIHVDEAVERLEAWRLVDDSAFAHQWVQERAPAKGATRAKLRRELEQKGVDAASISEAVAQVSAEDERARAHHLVAQRLRRHERDGLRDREARLKVTRRLVGFLQRRGYAPGIALAVVEAEVAAVLEES